MRKLFGLAGVILVACSFATSTEAADIQQYEAALATSDLPRLAEMFRADGAQASRGRDGKSVLHLATEWRKGTDRPAAIAARLAAGADPHVRDDRGNMPLHRAAYGDCADCVSVLLKAGAEVSARNAKGVTPLHLCDAVSIALLLNAGADTRVRDEEGVTPLHTNGNLEPRLLAPGVNVRDNFGFTPLHRAALTGDYERIDWLLANGADANIESTARYSNAATFDPKAFDDTRFDFSPGQRAYDLARYWYEEKKWSTGTPYLMVMERLDKHTPRRGLFRR